MQNRGKGLIQSEYSVGVRCAPYQYLSTVVDGCTLPVPQYSGGQVHLYQYLYSVSGQGSVPLPVPE